MNTHFKASIGFLIVALLLASPAVGLARENESKGKDKKQETHKVEKKDSSSKKQSDDDDKDDKKKKDGRKDSNSKTCLRAWGHIFAPGWLKKNADVARDGTCHLPFGIGKKFRGHNATTTPDTTAPVISSISSKPAKTQAEIRWTTNEKSDSTVFWSLTSPVDVSASATKSVTQKALVKDHQVIVKNLATSTTYYIVVRSRDAAGNTTTSETRSFTTKAPSTDTGAPTIGNVATIISTSTVRVGWTNNENATGRVFYSTTLPVALSGSGAQFINSASTSKSHSVILTSLTPNTTYYMVVESTDTSGNVSTSATFSAKTADHVVSDTTVPVISAVATSAGTSTATVTWTTNESADSKVFWSATSPVNLSSVSTPSVSETSLVTSHSLSLSSLATSTQYYLVIRSKDAAGNTTTSNEFSFNTGSGL